ncbi:MAG: hypothetical protein ACD_75C00533G0004 [uncultured bacterium]|nr:MAG: hypothetical protein ACD_75C00533G0004 [uncultured bacterium]
MNTISRVINILTWLKVFLLTLIIAFCSITVFDYYGPNLYELLSNSRFLAKMGKFLEEKEKTTHTTSESSQNQAIQQPTSDGRNKKEYEFSSQAIDNAKERVLRERNRQYWTQEEIDRIVKSKADSDAGLEAGGEGSYYYEIELVSGGRITTDDIVMKDGVVEYSNSAGLVVTVKKNEIKTIKRLKATAR